MPVTISTRGLLRALRADAAAREEGRHDVPRIRLVDVRWRPERPDGRAEYLASHLPGAVYADLDHELANLDADPRRGRRPLPDREQLEEVVRTWGVDDGDRVVVYDNTRGIAASRAWWLLSNAGVNVSILDGGLRSWADAGHQLSVGEPRVPRGNATLDWGLLPLATADDAASAAANGTLIDVRGPARYRGEFEPYDVRPGHIPGAVNAPTIENTTHEGRFVDAENLRAKFVGLGVREGRPIVAYCGSGVCSAHTVAALTIAGFRPAFYAGSWSEWSRNDDLPAALGSEPYGH